MSKSCMWFFFKVPVLFSYDLHLLFAGQILFFIFFHNFKYTFSILFPTALFKLRKSSYEIVGVAVCVKWSSVRCSFYFQKSCKMPFHSISVCASLSTLEIHTISGSNFYASWYISPWWFSLFNNIKSDLKPLRNIVLVLFFQKKSFFFLCQTQAERERASFLLPHADENTFSSFSRDGVLWNPWVYTSHFAQA